ncbi:UMP kinase [Phenylobacterium sp.]|uniref:UMP kinase n=1 Tax=Phenylobacterium sp. TaxID=1871053 RepID=UPI002EDB2211
MPVSPRHKRILIKLSGEAGVGGDKFGIDPATLGAVAEEIAQVARAGVQVCVVVGGGNIFRGAALAEAGMERASADYMGMLATVMNALALQASLEKLGVFTRVQSAIPMEAVCEPYIRRRALRHLEKGRVVIFAAGVGAPFFTTDSGAALRAAEMGCEALYKGTSVDGVYTADPKSDPSATRYETLSYTDVLAKNLKVMDASAVSLMRDNHIPIMVFNIRERGNLLKVLSGEGVFTTIA